MGKCFQFLHVLGPWNMWSQRIYCLLSGLLFFLFSTSMVSSDEKLAKATSFRAARRLLDQPSNRSGSGLFRYFWTHHKTGTIMIKSILMATNKLLRREMKFWSGGGQRHKQN